MIGSFVKFLFILVDVYIFYEKKRDVSKKIEKRTFLYYLLFHLQRNSIFGNTV